MMRVARYLLLVLLAGIFVLLVACTTDPERRTLAELHAIDAELNDVHVADGLDLAMAGYRTYLDENPGSVRTPEAMRRLADLQVEKEYGIRGGEGPSAALEPTAPVESMEPEEPLDSAAPVELAERWPAADDTPMPDGPREAIMLYQQLLATYPDYRHNDQVLYQKSRAYDELGLSEDAMRVMERLIAAYPASRYIDEVQFRRAEYFFTRRRFREAEAAYAAVTAMGVGSDFHELALYKLGWTLYRQDFYDEALHEFVALLDRRLAIGHDFELRGDEPDDRRVADTFRVISLSFSNLGGAEIVREYFEEFGRRSYEDRIYSNLGEFYFDKLRYHDAARTYQAFVELHPYHRRAPLFGMRTVAIYEAGGFPMLVVQAKKDFANRYGLQAGYWRHAAIAERPEVAAFLKSNLEDLANHFHALYQDELLADEQQANYKEAQHWYRAYLASFPAHADTPATHYQFADLLFEAGDFGQAALEYERVAYDYPHHEGAAAAAYAAVYAHRAHQALAHAGQQEERQRRAVESSLRFAAAFPAHEHAAVVLGNAADDLYALQQFERAIAASRTILERYIDAPPALQRSAWITIAHASFDLGRYAEAEPAYASALQLTAIDDESRQDLVDNLAATIYKQGELANIAEEYRTAADHFLRIPQVAPTSGIRAAAEYDAGAALMRLAEWREAAAVLEAFRVTHSEHHLNREATRQIAQAYRADGQLGRAAAEYERISAAADTAALAREALLLAGELYEEAGADAAALEAYFRYLERFPDPLEVAVETRFKIADQYLKGSDPLGYREQLQAIVALDAAAGPDRSDRTRYLAAQAGLVLAGELYRAFADVQLVQPFDRSLAEKQRRMDVAMAALEGLVDYAVGEVTAAATFYIAEVYYEFSRALLASERPVELDSAALLDYEMVIEEEAFPFEERAIEVHEKNLELMSAGVFNAWVERSLDKLADLMPGRYAKFELSSGFLASLDVYAYRVPAAPAGEDSDAPIDAAVDAAVMGEVGAVN